MSRSEKDRLAVEFEERWIDFQMALSDKRKRLESLVFAGYDSYFEGHEPPAL